MHTSAARILSPVMATIQIKPLRRSSRRDGYRVLALPVWPRSLRKDSVDLWSSELAPEPRLLVHRGCGLSPEAFAYVYGNYLDRPCVRIKLKPLALLALRKRLTILCGCRDAAYCHDGILAAALEKCRRDRDFMIDAAGCGGAA